MIPMYREYSESTRAEVERLERQYGINLHRNWKNPLPYEFLVVSCGR